MSKIITVAIDGKSVQAAEGMNIIDAAEAGGIHIPNLCYLKGMKGIGACRLCLVEVEGLKAPVIACNTKVKEGMAVRTRTDKIQEIRKFVIDLLLSMHPLDCMTCSKAGVCTLQRYAYDFGLKESSFRRKTFAYPADEANPFIKRVPDYCILCGRCVRVCKEQGTHVLEFIGRGIESKVVTAADSPLQESGCTFCGSCIDACPVNAFLESDGRLGREWEYERKSSVCLLCGSACRIAASTKDNQIHKISPDAPAGSAERYLCAHGRFGFDCVVDHGRIGAPMKRMNGELQETTWEDALGIVARRLKQAGVGTGFIVSGAITNEDALTLKRFAAEIVKTRNCDSTVSLYADGDYFISSQKTDIDLADLIILIDLNPSQRKRILPALDAAVRRRVNRGAKLIVISESECAIGGISPLHLKGNVISILKRIAKSLIEKGMRADNKFKALVKNVEITGEIDKAAALLAGASAPVIFSSPSFFEASACIARFNGKVAVVPPESNAKGVSLMGLISRGKSSAEMIEGETKLLYAVGEIPLRNRPNTDFLIVQNAHITPLARQADVVLPSAYFLETAGTVIDYSGRLKHLHRIVYPYGESMSHRDIFISLAALMGASLRRPTGAEVKKAGRLKMRLRTASFGKNERFAVRPDEFMESMNEPVLKSPRFLWLESSEKTVVG